MSYQPIPSPLPVSQNGTWTITVTGAPTALGQATMANSSPVVIASNQSAIPVTGTFFQATQPVSGTVTANLAAGTNNIGDVDVLTVNGVAPAFGSGARGATVQRVTIATDDVVPASQSGTWNIGTLTSITNAVAVTDNSGSLTVDAPVGTPVFVRLSDGTSAIATLPVSISGNQAVNNAQVGGTNVSTGNGVSGAGVQRVAIASDNTAFTVNAAQSGTWNIGSITTLPALVAGTALIGKVGLDQTTPGTTNAVSVAQIGATAVATGNGVVSAGVQRVAIASDNTAFSVNATLLAGTNGIGKLTANSGVTIGAVELAASQTLATVTNLSQLGGQAISMGTGVRAAGTLRVTVATDDLVPVSHPTLTKGTQGSAGVSTQDLKDAGRTVLAMTAEFTFAQTAETLLTMTLSSSGAATTTFTSRTITSGKRLRIQSAILQIETLGSGTAPQRAYLRMRVNTAGATTTSSPRQWILPAVNATAVVKSGNWASLEIPDGFEIAGDGTATFGFTLETPDYVATTATGRAFITVFGFEY